MAVRESRGAGRRHRRRSRAAAGSPGAVYDVVRRCAGRLVRGAAVVFLAVAAGGVGCGRGGPRVLRLSHITSPGSAWDRGAKRFAALLEEKSGGRFRVMVYPGAQLAQHNQKTELQQLCSGAIDMTLESPIILALFLDRRFDVFSLPWLFPDHATANAVCDGPFGRQALGWLDKHGVVGLAWGVNGFRQLTNSKRPVRTPADLKGMKVRVAGTDLFRAVFRAFGANPTTMNFGELFTALEQGAVDAQENPLSIIWSSKLYEVQRYCTVWNYAYDPIILCVNKDVWQSFSPEDQELIRQCAREAMDYERKLVAEDDRRLVAELRAKGMRVDVLTDAEKAAFRKECEPVYAEFAPRIGESIVQDMLKAVAAARKIVPAK